MNVDEEIWVVGHTYIDCSAAGEGYESYSLLKPLLLLLLTSNYTTTTTTTTTTTAYC